MRVELRVFDPGSRDTAQFDYLKQLQEIVSGRLEDQPE